MSSPSVRNTVKRTYQGHSKRKAKAEKAKSDSDSYSDSSSDEEKPKASMPPPATPANKKAAPSFKVPGPKDSAQADAISSSPSQKPESSAKGKKTHVRNSSSISSLRRAAQGSDIASPASLSKPISRSRFAPPRDEPEDAEPEETDDGASVADSFISTNKIRRTEAERIEYFRNQPECGDIEPHRAFCTRCQKHVGLGKKQTYTVRPWETHRAKCDQKVPASMLAAEDDAEDEAASAAAPSVSEATVRRSEPERKAILEADSRAEEVEPFQALCRKCHKWIKLSSKQRYALSSWNRHQRSCADSVPSARVTTAQRQVYLFNDKQARDPQPKSVECKACDATITLEGDGDYNLASWQQHKTVCTPKNLAGSASAAHAPPSVASTDGTLIPDASPVSSGKKRAREEEPEEAALGLAADEDERPTNRPRTENYQAPDAKPPGPFGWFLELPPVKSFLDGFRERFAGGKTPVATEEGVNAGN